MEVEAPGISRQSAPEGGNDFIPTHRPPLPRQGISQSHVAAVTITAMKNHNDTFGNRTRDLPACSTPRAHPPVGRFSNIQPHRSLYSVNIPAPL